MDKPDRMPLAGIRVLDATHVVAGPFATYQLALLGADVTRIERVNGNDFVRGHGGTSEMKNLGLGATFLSQNACKRSVALNLKDFGALQVFKTLATTADIFIENFRPGVAERLGIGFDVISKINERIIYCSLSGYGQTGPLQSSPAYDHILQGFSGLMAMTGSPESGPMRVGFPITDYISGQTAVNAILAALHQRDRNDAGAQHVQVSMLDSIVSMMGAYAVDFHTTGKLRGLEGNSPFSASPFSGRFETRTHYLVVTANTDEQANQLCALIGHPELMGETNAEIVRETIALRFLEDSAEEWEVRLNEAGVPAAMVRDLSQVLAHPQLQANGLMQNLDVPQLDLTVPVPGLPFTSNGWEKRSLDPAPRFGADTRAMLERLGKSETEIDHMMAIGAIDSANSRDPRQGKPAMFKALIVDKDHNGKTHATVKDLSEDQLPEGDVLVDVEYSSLNYKDGLCLGPGAGLVHSYPHVPGIDLAGRVASSKSPKYQEGDRVVLTGWRVGETHWGGYAQKASLKSVWLVPLPEKLSTRQAMAVGTAGLTAMLAIMALEDRGLTKERGPVLVTGAAGGVGSIATAVLAKLGYEVAAVTGRPETTEYLLSLGATTVVPRDEFSAGAPRLLESERWAGCVDAVGGRMLARVLGQMRYGGSAAAVGLAGGRDLPTTVVPFLLRGVSLIGIDSVMQPFENRLRAWRRVATDLPLEKLDAMTEVFGMADLPKLGDDILHGRVRGRVVIDTSR